VVETDFNTQSLTGNPVPCCYENRTRHSHRRLIIRAGGATLLSRTFGAEKLNSGEELTTVAKGFALRALEHG
jgi:hypothetical protein